MQTLRLFILICVVSCQWQSVFPQQQLQLLDHAVDQAQDTRACGVETATLPSQRGAVSVRGKHPWAVAIYRTEPWGVKYRCGGSLISARAVITVAHCVVKLNANEVIVYLGRHNLGELTEIGYETSNVTSLIVHPDYQRLHSRDADIAVLRLAHILSFTDLIRPICLWDGALELSDIAGHKGTVAGWGATEQDGSRSLDSLSRVFEVEILPKRDCVDFIRNIFDLSNSRVFCANNTDANGLCFATSGNGLMLKQHDRWQLRGIVSLGVPHQCNPVIYTDLAQYLPWVRAAIE